jgi:hypothetical protein
VKHERGVRIGTIPGIDVIGPDGRVERRYSTRSVSVVRHPSGRPWVRPWIERLGEQSHEAQSQGQHAARVLPRTKTCDGAGSAILN